MWDMPDPAEITTVLGFDYGDKRIGVAVGQTITATASALPLLKAHNGAPDWQQVTQLIEQWRPQALVVGLPFHADGSEFSTTQKARRFGNRLNGRYHLPVFWMNETLSSVGAEALQRESAYKQDLDSLAAKIIVEDWLATRTE